VFEEAPSLPLEKEENEWTTPLQKFQGCYNINATEDDDPRNVNITKIEGQRDIEGPRVELPFIGQPIKIKKVNIGTEQTPKLANVGDYWNAATIDKITELLHEYHDLFPTKFTDMKGIKGPMGEMRIPLKSYARLVKQIPYRLNPKYKEKVKIELDRMLEAIVPMKYLVPSLKIAAFTNMDDIGIVQERLLQLVELEEEKFIAGFHQQVQKEREKAYHDRHIKKRHLSKVIWYWHMTVSS
jgi:hypothetical protein